HVLAQRAVVGHVRVGHEHAVAADAGRGPGLGGEVRSHVLADLGGFADFEERGLGARVLEILRRAPQHGAVMDAAAVPDPGPAGQQRVAADRDAVADANVRADHGPRSDVDAGSDLCALVHERRGMDHRAHGARRSTTVASSSASATSWLPTYASPRIFEVAPLSLRSVSSKRSWSPGVTGRRKRAPSMPMKYTSFSVGSSTECRSRRPPICAMASMIRTAGMIGWPGKCPWKKGSLMVTFLMPSIRRPSSRRVMRSTSRKG